MEKFNKIFGGVKVMTFAAIASFASVFGLSSCQDDSYVDESCMTQETQETPKATDKEDVNDSVFVNTYKFDYDGLGVTTALPAVGNVDFNPLYNGANGMSTRALGTTDMALKTLYWGVDKIAGAILGQAGSAAFKKALGDCEIIQILFADKTAESLSTIAADVAKLNEKIDQLDENVDNKEVARYFNERVEAHDAFITNASFLKAYMEHMQSGKTEAAKATLDEWAKETAPKSVITFMKGVVSTQTGKQLTTTDIYDYWVYRITPWEHKGYELRDQLRFADIYAASSGCILATAYYQANPTTGGAARAEEVKKAYDDFMKYYQNRATVQRHYDKLICQIKNATIIYDKDIVVSNMTDHPWYPSGTEWNNSNDLKRFMYTEEGRSADDVIKSSLSSDEAKAIANYYASVDTLKTIEAGFIDAGFNFDVLDKNRPHVLPLSDGCNQMRDSWTNRNYYLRYNKAALVKEQNPIKSDWTVGIMWLEHDFGKALLDISGHKNNDSEHCVLRRWHSREHEDAQYFHLKIDKRYNGMYPLGQNNKAEL